MPHFKFIIAGGLIIGAIGFLMFSGVGDSMVYYYRVSEVLEKASELQDTGIRVSGFVEPGSIQVHGSESRVNFVVFEKESDSTISVVYEGLVPDTFKDHAEVVVEGTFQMSDQSLFREETAHG